MTKRRIILCAGLSLLVTATSASAECAWVLWERAVVIRGDGDPGGTWLVLDSTQTLPECKASAGKSLKGSIDLAEKEGLSYTVDETTVTSTDVPATPDVPATFLKIVKYLCLPEAVDPRGPKGK